MSRTNRVPDPLESSWRGKRRRLDITADGVDAAPNQPRRSVTSTGQLHPPPPPTQIFNSEPELRKFFDFFVCSNLTPSPSITPSTDPEQSFLSDGADIEDDRFTSESELTPESSLSDSPWPEASRHSHGTSNPGIPDRTLWQVNCNLKNPFQEGSVGRYNNDKRKLKIPKTDGFKVNGYLKFNIDRSQKDTQTAVQSFDRGSHGFQHGRQWKTLDGVLQRLPRNFGKVLKLDQDDHMLFVFYLTAYCSGRTLIQQDNFWLKEIAPMADSSPLVKEAMLAFAGSYVLDYAPSESLIRRTNNHYAKASELITHALKSPESHSVDQSGPLVAALILMEAEDEVIWELRRPKHEIPNFHRGNLLARQILDHSDPGYRYWISSNVQYTKSWLGLSCCVAVGCILAEIMSPSVLPVPESRGYGWLLGGNKEDVRTIYGAKGFSPKLIHMLGRITHWSAKLIDNPSSIVIPRLAAALQKNLDNLRQRSRFFDTFGFSEFVRQHTSTSDLLRSCGSDDNDGKVRTSVKVTQLAGEAWLCAAKIYLHCRLFRKPPWHHDVQINLRDLTSCIKLLPEKGPLLTAQSPFFPVFLMAIVSCTQEDRDIAKKWFRTVTSEGGRSNVPPVWEATKLLWAWLDQHVNRSQTLEFDENTPLGQRKNWWEEMVAYLQKEVGWMSLT